MRNKLLARLAIGVVVTGSLLAPQAASALDFTFSFAGVTGLIENLVEGQNTCYSYPPNEPACFVNVTNTGGANSDPVGLYIHKNQEASFTVVRGSLALADFEGDGPTTPTTTPELFFCNPQIPRSQCARYSQPTGILMGYSLTVGVLTFAAVQPPTPSSTSVPGPLPALGVAAAFGYSRKLRNRIKKSGNSAASTFTL